MPRIFSLSIRTRERASRLTASGAAPFSIWFGNCRDQAVRAGESGIRSGDRDEDCARVTLVFYRKRAFENECAWARCSGALSIKPLEGSRSRVRRTRGADVLLLGFICAILAPGRPSCKTAVQTLRSYTRGSVRRASGFVLKGNPEIISR